MEAQGLADRYDSLPIFDGFPYLVTKLTGAMHHVIALPRLADASLETLAVRQYAANRLPTCLVRGVDDALYISERGVTRSALAPRCEIPRYDRLLPAAEFVSRELFEREQLLLEFAGSVSASSWPGPTAGRRR